jgi:two-component system phosphate regulon response regulator PhoB
MEPESISQIEWPDSCCNFFIQMHNLSGKVLIVEDHSDSREILKLQLQALGYEVAVATCGEEALEKALTEAPDIIIMDLGLPGMSGIEATAKLKENTETTKLPVLAYTALREDLYREKAEQAGMVAYLTKPAQYQVINEVIQRVFRTTPQT